MNSIRLRLAMWFVVGFLALTAVFTLVTYRALEKELRQKTWQKDYPEHPDWQLHGSYSEAEVRDVVKELVQAALIWVVPLAGFAAGLGYWLARKSLRPIASVNRQLEAKHPGNLGEPIQLTEVDEEFRGLLRQLNDLLKRLDASFAEMNTYAAKVAHELRTPLAIIRLKVEQAENRIAPDLADELEDELHRLTHVVDQSLLIARAEQGRVLVQRTVFNVAAVMADMVQDFQLLAAEEQRSFTLIAPEACWVLADVQHFRQMTHNLLVNALKHGQGNLTVRVRRQDGRANVFIVNFVSRKNIPKDGTLGLGLRVVAALLRLESDINFQRRRGNGYYAVRVNLPRCDAPPEPGSVPVASVHNS